MKRDIHNRWAAAIVVAAVVAAAASVGASFAIERDDPMDELWRMHDAYVLAFIDSEGFGERRLPAMSGLLHQPVEGTPWFVADLQLIGVAKHDPPRVFGGGFSMDVFHQPNEDVPLTRGRGRAISPEQLHALRDLDAGQRLVAHRRGSAGLEVVGAIRAGDECLGCHKNKSAGDMLGAFVYRLEPLPKTQQRSDSTTGTASQR